MLRVVRSLHFHRVGDCTSYRKRQMRVTLIHNPVAGDGEVSATSLVAALRENGYQPDYWSSKPSDVEKALADPYQLVVVAGGDGTVAEVAKRLAGRGIPIAVLPAGTANNIAAALGADGSLRVQIEGWASGRRQPFDVGRARGPWGEKPFVESVGCGAVADMMACFDRKEQPMSAPAGSKEGLDAARQELRKTLRHVRPGECHLVVDGQDCSGRYLLVEVMNIRRIGPRLLLAPEADPGDGRLDVVTLGEEYRDELDAYLREPASRSPAAVPPGVVARQAQRISLDPLGERVHLDDETWPAAERAAEPVGPVHLNVEPQALVFLSPRLSKASRQAHESGS